MNGFAKKAVHSEIPGSAFTRNARASFMGSKIMQAIGVEASRLDAVHNAMWLRLVDENANSSTPIDECDRLAAHIVAVARIAEKASASGGPKVAIAAVERESGRSIDPLIAQNFLRLAASPIFWMVLDSASEATAD
jgi:hypothetical protein